MVGVLHDVACDARRLLVFALLEYKPKRERERERERERVDVQ